MYSKTSANRWGGKSWNFLWIVSFISEVTASVSTPLSVKGASEELKTDQNSWQLPLEAAECAIEKLLRIRPYPLLVKGPHWLDTFSFGSLLPTETNRSACSKSGRQPRRFPRADFGPLSRSLKCVVTASCTLEMSLASACTCLAVPFKLSENAQVSPLLCSIISILGTLDLDPFWFLMAGCWFLSFSAGLVQLASRRNSTKAAPCNSSTPVAHHDHQSAYHHMMDYDGLWWVVDWCGLYVCSL